MVDCNDCVAHLVHQNHTIAIASVFRVVGPKLPEIPQKESISGSEIAARKLKSLATNRNAALFYLVLESRAISEVRNHGHRNCKSQKTRVLRLPVVLDSKRYRIPFFSKSLHF